MSSDPTKLLDVKNLTIDFQSKDSTVHAVKGISFDLMRGECLGIVGESGSGKSVTALSVMRLHPTPPAVYKDSEIWYHGEDGPINLLNANEEEIRRHRGAHIAMIFQDPMSSLNPSHRAGNQVTEAIFLHQKLSASEAKEYTLNLFKRTGLKDPERVFNSYPHQLSGGQIQRVMIAMAISCKPKILIADEPTTALDVTVQQQIMALLDDIRKESGTSIIFISHDLGLVNQISDKILVMQHGRIVEKGITKEVFDNPQDPYTKGLIACRPRMDRRVRRLPTVEGFLSGRNDQVDIISDSEYISRIDNLESSESILEVHGLKKSYPASKSFWGRIKTYTHAVDDVSFKVKKGEVVGLVGESGSGKSTLSLSLLNLIPIDDGKVLFESKNVHELRGRALKNLRKDFQIIFQNPYASLNPRMKIGRAILEPMQVHKMYDGEKQRMDKVMDLLEKVGLEPDHYSRYPHEFSGGQRQRICIARSLSLSPKFIICDECVSALDVSVQAQILNLLLDLREQFDLSYLFISHDLSVVKFISDRVMVMRSGKIIESNDAEAIYSNPQSDYTRRLIEAIPD